MRSQPHLVIRYTLLLTFAGILAGIVLHLIRRLVGGNTLARFLGTIIAALTGAISAVLSLFAAPNGVASLGIIPAALAVLTHLAMFGAASLLFKAMRGTSSGATED